MNVSPNRVVVCLFALWALAASGCAGDAAPLRALPADAVVLAFGDSLTYGTGASRDASYPVLLERLAGRRVVNAGVPGEESAEGVERLPRLLEEHRPSLVIICHGGNDILRKRDRQALGRNLERMVTASRGAGADVMLLGVPEFGLFLSVADVYSQVADAGDVSIENQVLPRVLSDRGLKSDSVHPNAEGYRRIATAVAELLRREGAL